MLNVRCQGCVSVESNERVITWIESCHHPHHHPHHLTLDEPSKIKYFTTKNQTQNWTVYILYYWSFQNQSICGREYRVTSKHEQALEQRDFDNVRLDANATRLE